VKYKFNDSKEKPREKTQTEPINVNANELGSFIEDRFFIHVYFDENNRIIDFFYLYE